MTTAILILLCVGLLSTQYILYRTRQRLAAVEREQAAERARRETQQAIKRRALRALE